MSGKFNFSMINNNHNHLEANPGNISCSQENIGGISYGIYQFASSVGVPQSFVGWLNKKGHPYGRMLSRFAAGTREFSCCWQYIGEHDAKEFEHLQDEFVETNYFMPAMEHLKKEFSLDINNYRRLKEVVWMMAVDFGPHKTVEIMRKVQTSKLFPPRSFSQVEEAELIEYINDVLATDEWLETKKQLASGLCSPFIQKEYIHTGKLSQNSV